MLLGHLGSCLTHSMTGRYAFNVICRLVFEMATRYKWPSVSMDSMRLSIWIQ